MSCYKVLLLIFFSAMIGFMAAFKPLMSVHKKASLLEQQQECSCPESGCDEDGETNKNQEDPEWGDEFYIAPYSVFRIHFSIVNFRTFSYWVHTPEYFASISIPPPEV